MREAEGDTGRRKETTEQRTNSMEQDLPASLYSPQACLGTLVYFWFYIILGHLLKRRSVEWHNFNKHYVSGRYPSSCFYLKRRFGDCILSPSSGRIYSVGPNR
jgi:hypothetical protein